MTKKRNGEIDILRLVFCIIILFHHFGASFNHALFKNAYICVEFFFLLSGFLMAKSANKILQQKGKLESLEIADTSWRFIINKIKPFYPYYAFAIIFQVIVRNIIINHDSLASLISNFLRSIPTFTLTFLGYNNSTKALHVGSTWYLSAMVIAIFILFPLLLKNFHGFTKLVFPVASMFIVGYLSETDNAIGVWAKWSGFCFNGILRALSGLAFGASMFVLTEWVKKKYLPITEKSPIAKTFFTVIKIVCAATVFAFIFGFFSSNRFDVHAFLLCALGIVISFSGISYTIPSSKLTDYLSKISLPIYIFHSIIRYSIEDIFGNDIFTLKWMVVVCIATIFACILLMYVTEHLSVFLKKATVKILKIEK